MLHTLMIPIWKEPRGKDMERNKILERLNLVNFSISIFKEFKAHLC